MATQSTTPSPEEMADRLWKSKEINKFIEQYNKVSGLGTQKLRIELVSPHIYVVVLNKPGITIKGKNVLLVKVGFTQVSVDKETDNRMKEVAKEIQRNLKTIYTYSDDKKPKVSILFKFLIHALDIRPFRDVEKSVREKVGFPLPPEIAKEWGLPVFTEWALTTQGYIDEIKQKIEALKGEKEVISTKIFKSELGDNKKCNLPAILGITEAKLTQELEEMIFPLEKAESSASEMKDSEKTRATPEESQTAGESSTSEASAAQTTKETRTSKKEAKGRGKKTSATDKK